MEIYLDANATTPVLEAAKVAAIGVMMDDFGNPSSVHGAGLKARALMNEVRSCARRVLGAPTGQMLFLSGATEGIQTAVLSALNALRGRLDFDCLLYGATEHKVVPEALEHWNSLLGLDLQVLSIPVGSDGRHDLNWLRERAPRAGLVCTMAANNETGVVSDLEGIAAALRGSKALWLVDAVQALGKLSLRISDLPIDYAAFSGHKLYAPKGIGLLYVREGAPFTSLLTGGGQESALRSGTENMPGIAALGAVLDALERGNLSRPRETLARYRVQLSGALREAFPGILFNTLPELCLPTTLNFSVPGVDSKVLLDLFDAADMRISGGSACSASNAEPSHVLEAMGLPRQRSASAVRLSFGPASEPDMIEEACRRIRSCGQALRENCMIDGPPGELPPCERVTRFVVDGACCYLVADAASRRCLVIDPLPELTGQLFQWICGHEFVLAAVLDTHSHGDHASSASALRAGVPAHLCEIGRLDALGWPQGSEAIALGELSLNRLPIPGHTQDSTAYLLADSSGPCMAFVGDMVMPGALGRSDFEDSDPLAFGSSLRDLQQAVGPDTFLLPGHDYEGSFACTLRTERVHQPLLDGMLDGSMDAVYFATTKAMLEENLPPTRYQTMACGAQVGRCTPDEGVELERDNFMAMIAAVPTGIVVDVREPYEQRQGRAVDFGEQVRIETVPLSVLVNALPRWLALPRDTPLLFFCRSGNRSAQAARALRRLGHAESFSLAGGIALWPRLAPTERSSSVDPTS